jgi:hypothetical protein
VATSVVVWLGAAAMAATTVPGPALRGAITALDIDVYPRGTRVTGCADPLVGKPGVAAFRELILTQVGGADDGLAVCKKIANDSGSYSDHADGRAWDWHMHADNPADAAVVDQVLNWLLRTDERGNQNAVARRIGITYIIWNHQVYRVRDDGAAWRPYTSTADPHDTHVHFSFSMAGATRETSWWRERGPLLWLLSGEPGYPDLPGAGALQAVVGDWDGDGRDTVGVYNPATRRFSVRGRVLSTDPIVTTPPIGALGAIPIAGDWDGAGGDEIGLYEPWNGQFLFFDLTGVSMRPAQIVGAPGHLPIVGDWDGNGISDVGTYQPGGRTFSMVLGDGTVRSIVFGDRGDTPVTGDWDGDGTDDVGTFTASSNTFRFDAAADAGGVVQPPRHGNKRQLPVVGDWDGDGVDTHGIVTPDG